MRGRARPLTLRWKPEAPRSRGRCSSRNGPPRGNANRRDGGRGRDTISDRLPPTSRSSGFELTGGDDWLGPIWSRSTGGAGPDQVPGQGARCRRDRPVGVWKMLASTWSFCPTPKSTDPRRNGTDRGHPAEGPHRHPQALEPIDARTFADRVDPPRGDDAGNPAHLPTTGLDSRPLFLSIGLLKEREPRVTLPALGVGGHVTPVATIPLSIGATDDFGGWRVRLQVERTTRGRGEGQGEGRAADKSRDDPPAAGRG